MAYPSRTCSVTHPTLLAALLWCIAFPLMSPTLLVGQEATSPASVAGPGDAPLANPLATDQTQVATRFKRLEGVLLRSAEVEETTNPTRAALLKQAAAMAKQVQLTEALVRAAKSLEQKQFSQAVKDQQSSLDNLERLLQLLQSENRPDRLRKDQDQIRRWIEEADRLLRLQSSLRGRTEGGTQTEKAAADQQKLAEKAAQIAMELGQDDKKPSDKVDASTEGDKKDGDSKDGDSKDGSKDGDKKSSDKDSADKDSSDKEGGEKEKSGDKSSEKPNSEKDKPGKDSDRNQPGSPKDSQGADKKDGGSGKDSDSKPGEPGSKSDKDQANKDAADKDKSDKDKSKDGEPSSDKSSEPSPGKPQDSNSPGQPSPGQPSPAQPPQPGQQSQPGQQQPGQQSPQQSPQQPQSPTERAAQALKQAQQRMQEAQKQLEEAEREGAVEKQRQAEQELQAAIEQLEEILRQLREEEIERSLAALEERIRLMLQLQNKVLDETKRLHDIGAGGTDRQVEIRASSLANDEKKILGEGQRALLLLREEGTSAAFPEALAQIIADMQNVQERLTKADVGKLTISLEQEIVASLEELVSALAEVQKDKKEKSQQQPNSPGQQQQQSGEKPLVDQLAELRLIKTLQLRINKRTQLLSEVLKDPNDAVGQADADDIQSQLRELSQRQSNIKQVTRDIVTGKNKQ